MSSPINLNKVRKAREKAQKKAKSAENTVKFGRSKAKKQVEDATKAKLLRLTDGHRLDKP